MAQAIIIHGTPDKQEYFDPNVPTPSNSHWLPWLQKQFILAGYEAQTPEMPMGYHPNYPLWEKELNRYTVDSETILVGHSCGAGFLLRWLSERKISPQKVILVAPWMDPSKSYCVPGFFDFTIDRSLANRTDLHVIYSDNDDDEVNQSVKYLMQELPEVKKHLLQGMGHFVGFDAFLALKDIALKI